MLFYEVYNKGIKKQLVDVFGHEPIEIIEKDKILIRFNKTKKIVGKELYSEILCKYKELKKGTYETEKEKTFPRSVEEQVKDISYEISKLLKERKTADNNRTKQIDERIKYLESIYVLI